ncbi:PA0069 family radical SAM protein [Danxiaibacter flavus]|uniref:PA0069 family radical SAM protein n=1 Tax=Danxiaibacter flavus TaxID=3049108 RepID=A0ABV3ZLN7_9BACT|nr:PA0069 family radical SAM protein [Chitinophagaceae bacterium DXS]
MKNIEHNPNEKPRPQNKDRDDYFKGRGAQFNTKNKFLKTERVKEHIEGIDDWTEHNTETTYIEEHGKTLVNKVESPDVGMFYSMNPYQGCEHGCIYCYARNSFEYWGYSAGLDFERKIIVKKNAPELLRKFLMNPKWECLPISLSGNTDCYQPAEKKFRITRQLLEVCLEFNQPVGMITKNAGMLRDKDIIQEMAKRKLISILVSITSFNEDLRRVMEPRTTTGQQRLRIIKELSDVGVRMGVMLGPMIPGLNEHEMQRIMKAASENGATFSAYTFIRLNGSIQFLFHDWLYKNFPDRADKVWHLIQNGHGGQVNDSRFGVRMRGEGPISDLVRQQFHKYNKLYNLNAERWELDCSKFRRPGEQGRLF